MNVSIARDGTEIGQYPMEELRARARDGEIAPDDWYWHEGMEKWDVLQELLDRAACEPPPAPAPAKNYLLLIVGAIATVVVLGGIALLSTKFSLSSPSSPSVPATPPVVQTEAVARASAPEPTAPAPTPAPDLRDQAMASLDQLMTKLPRAATPPANLVYYALNVVVSEHPVALKANIAGAEDTVDPVTQKTLSHTPFLLGLVYRDSQWMYSDYMASTTNLTTGEVTEIDGRQKNALPPTIVSLLGLPPVPEMAEPEATPP